MNTGKWIVSAICGAMTISSASASVAYIYCDEFYSSSFEYDAIGVGITEPYWECTYKEPTYIEPVLLDDNKCAECWWTEEPYDNNPVRLRRGIEAF